MSCSRYLIVGVVAWAIACAVAGCDSGERAVSPPPDSSTATGTFEVADDPLIQAVDETLMSFAVEGMHCEGCALSIARTLARMPGVRKARASFDRRTAWLLCGRDQGPQTAAVVAALADLGYQARPADNASPQAPATAAVH